MGNGNTDVELVIRAKDASSQALTAVTSAIEKLTGAQTALVEGAGPASSLLDQLRSAMVNLSGALDTADASLERAQAQFDRQNQTLAETKDQLAAVQAQSEAAGGALERLNKQFATGPQLAGFYEQLAGVTAEQKSLNAQANQLTASLTKQQAAVAKAGAALEQMRSANRVAGSAAAFGAGASPGAAAANAEATESANNANKAFEIMALEAADAAEKESAAMGEAATAAGNLARNLPPIAPAAAEASASVKSLRDAILSTIASFIAMPSAEERAAAATQVFGERSSAATQAIRLLRYEVFSLALSFVGPYGVIQAIGSVLTAYTAMQSAEQKLGIVFNQNGEQVRTEMQFLRDLSIQLGMSFSTLADQYSTIAVSAQEAGFSLDNTRKLFVAVADAARVLHLSADDTNRVFLAFREMLSKGVVQSTQLQRQLGNDMPAAIQIFADALGVSTAKLTQMMKAGQVFADQETLTAVADRLNEKYGKQLPQALQTAQTQIGRFEALMQQAEVQFGNGGFIDQLNKGLSQLNQYLQTSDAREFFSSLGSGFGKLVSLVPVIARNFNLITGALKAWVAVKVGMWLLDLVSKMGSVATAARAMWVAIGGLPGLLLTGAAFTLEGFLGDWLTGIDKATAALDEHQRILDAVQKAYDDAGRKIDGWAQKIKDTTQAQILANLNSLKAQATATQQSLPNAPHTGEMTIDLATGGLAASITPPDKQLQDIIQAFKDGKTSYDQFKQALSDFGVANPQFLSFTAKVLDQAQKFNDLQTAIKQADAALDVIRGHATAADLRTLGLDAANGWQDATNQADKFSAAMDKIQQQAPDLKKQLQFQTNLDNAKAAFVQAINAAEGDPVLVARAAQLYNEVVAKVHALAASDAAKDFPLDNKAIIERIIYVESNGKVTAQNPNSSAAGLGQVTKDTWISIFKEIFPQLANQSDSYILAYRSNTDVMMKVLDYLTRQNEVILAQHNIPTTPTNVYLAHFLGAGTAVKMILANSKELASDIAGAAATKANPSVLGGGKTAGDVLSWAAGKMGGPSPILSTGETQVEKFTADLNTQIQAWKDDAAAAAATGAAQTLSSQRALFVQQQVNDWTKKAVAAQFDQTAAWKAFVPQIEAAAGALFDAQHAAEAVQKAVDSVVGIGEQRKTAIEELQTAFSDGSSVETVDALKAKVAGLTEQLQQLLPLAQATVAALGDPRMVEALEKVNQQLTTLKTGLTNAKQINVDLADGLTSAWDNFTQSLTQSRKILVDVRNAFLQFAQDFLQKIADMILKQLLLNAIGQTGIGKSISDWINGATGTDVGGSAALSTAGTTLTTAGTGLTTAATGLTSAASQLVAAAQAIQAAATSGGSGGGGGFGGILSSILGSSGIDSAATTSAGLSDLATTLPTLAFHSGGIVGQSGGMRRSVLATVFAQADRYHGGGIPGLRPSEIPAILQRGEEVLRRDDPRHMLNGGGGIDMPAFANVLRAAVKDAVKVQVINATDPADMVSKGLGSAAGVKAFLNVIGSNRTAVRAMLG